MWRVLFLCLSAVWGAGCLSTAHHGPTRATPDASIKLFVPPFFNATDDDHAGRALTEITTAVLLQRGIPVVQTEPVATASRDEKAPGKDGLFQETAKTLGATHLLIGTVHEYRYKTDLDGDPVVGITFKLVDAQSGKVLWQGTSSRVSIVFASLSEAAQKAVDLLARRIPLPKHHAGGSKPN